jgi:putative addiction module component (TIGR02574 family)
MTVWRRSAYQNITAKDHTIVVERSPTRDVAVFPHAVTRLPILAEKTGDERAKFPVGSFPCGCWYYLDMNERMTTLAEEAERLPAPDRIKLVERLLTTLDKPDAAIDRAWAEESERRLEAYLRGEETARDATDVLGKYLKP